MFFKKLTNRLSEPVASLTDTILWLLVASGLISEAVTWVFNPHLLFYLHLQPPLPKPHLSSSCTVALAVPQTAASGPFKPALPFARQQIPSSELLAPSNLQEEDQVPFPESQSRVCCGLYIDLHQAPMTLQEDVFTVCLPVRLGAR